MVELDSTDETTGVPALSRTTIFPSIPAPSKRNTSSVRSAYSEAGSGAAETSPLLSNSATARDGFHTPVRRTSYTSLPSSASSTPPKSQLRKKLAVLKSYGTFLLGMPDQDPLLIQPGPPGKGKAKELSRASNESRRTRKDKGPASKWEIVRGYFDNRNLELENKGSVARDHLANERTFLAWTRTSLSLASIGVAITQLFRLSSSTYTLPDSGSNPNATASAYSSLPSTSASSSLSLSEADLPSIVANLIATIDRQQVALDALGTSTKKERARYASLGKPMGGTFIMLGVTFMLLGAHRYLTVQHKLATKNHFPPARRTILVVSTTIGALLIAAFVTILVIK